MNKGTKVNEYNPVVNVWFEEKGRAPFRIECLLEEVFMDNPMLEASMGHIVSSLQETGKVRLSNSLSLETRH
jgi:hypothetical protein